MKKKKKPAVLEKRSASAVGAAQHYGERKQRKKIRYRCEFCGAYFVYFKAFRGHREKCKKTREEQKKRKEERYRCKFCNVEFVYSKAFQRHQETCQEKSKKKQEKKNEWKRKKRQVDKKEKRKKKEKMCKMLGFRENRDDAESPPVYACRKCKETIRRFNIDQMVFHRCPTEKTVDEKLYTKIDLNKSNAGASKKCYTCKKLFPTDEQLFEHYRQKMCSRNREAKKQDNVYYKCKICFKHYRFYSQMQRHLRTHTFNKRLMKRMARRGIRENPRGGGRAGHDGYDDDDDDDEMDDVPLAHFADNDPISPARWGFTNNEILLNAPDLDGEELVRVMMKEIRAEIRQRRADNGKKGRRNEEKSFNRRYSMLSMLAVLHVIFYKIDLGSNLGESEQGKDKRRTSRRQKPTADNHDKTGDDGQTLIPAYFHSNPVLLLQGNLEQDLAFLVENFELQIHEYVNLKSGLKLFQVKSLELKFYDYESMWGGKVEKPLPSHCYMTLSALYTRGKILHVSYEFVGDEHGDESIKENDCFRHVLAAHHYLKSSNAAREFPTEFDGRSGYVLRSYKQIHVRDLMMNAGQQKCLERYDFSMCKNEGRPMCLADVPKFYRANCKKDRSMPYINLFTLEHADMADDAMSPNEGIDSIQKLGKRKYIITQYFAARDYYDDDDDADRKVVNILYWSKTQHFYLICNMKALIKQVNFAGRLSTKRSKQEMCYICMNFVDTRVVSIDNHVKVCRNHVNGKQHVRYLEPGKNIEEFKDYRLNNKTLIFACADSESSLPRVEKPDTGFVHDSYGDYDDYFNDAINNASYEKACRSGLFPLSGETGCLSPTQVHRLNSLAVKIHVDDEIVGFPHKDFEKSVGNYTQIMIADGNTESSEEALVDRFIDYLNRASSYIKKWLMQNNDKQVQEIILEKLKLENASLIESSTHCIYCRKLLPENPDERCLDHCHLTRKARGMACKVCNLKARGSYTHFKLLTYFHNFSGYDSSFIVRYMKNKYCGDETRRSDIWKVRMNGEKMHQLKTNLLEFRDSYDIVPVGIGTLSSNLSKADMKNVSSLLWTGESVEKNMYPYSWVNGVERFREVNFPTIDKFTSLLHGKARQKDYDYSKKLYDVNCETFADWHEHYLEMDVLILLDGLLFWQDSIHKLCEIDLLQCQSLPSCAKQSMLNFTRVELEVITDPTMNNLFLDSVKGGLCVTSLRSYVVKDPTEESIRYFDIKSLYACIQRNYRHPVGGYEYLFPVPSPDYLTKLALKYDEKTATVGYLCIVDLKIPTHLHDLLSDFPVTFTKTTYKPEFYPPSSKWFHLPKSTVPKLIPSLFDPKEYGVSMLSLQFLVRLGLIIEKVHQVVSFNQEFFLKDFIDLCLKKRKESGLKMDDVAFKLFANGLFGKYLENMFKYSETKMVFDKSNYDRLLKHASRFINAKFEKYGVLMTTKPAVLLMNKCVAVGFSILCKSKAHFQSMYYFDILPAYIKVARPITSKNRLRILYVDTDSCILKLTLNFDQEKSFYSLLEDLFDFSMLPTNDRFYSIKNAAVVGIFKDEMKNGVQIKGVHSNGAKSYVVELENNTGVAACMMSEEERCVYYPEIKLKALSKFYQATLLQVQDFLNAFHNTTKEQSLTYTTLRLGYRRRMFTFRCKRKVLCTHDSKRYVHPQQKDSIALGHYLTFDKVWVKKLMSQKDPYTWPVRSKDNALTCLFTQKNVPRDAST